MGTAQKTGQSPCKDIRLTGAWRPALRNGWIRPPIQADRSGSFGAARQP